MLSSLIESSSIDDPELIEKSLQSQSLLSIQIYQKAGGQFSNQEADAFANLEKTNLISHDLLTLKQIYLNIKKQKKISEQPFNAFVSAFCYIDTPSEKKARIIQGRVILTAYTLSNLKGYNDVIKRALDAVRVLFFTKNYRSVFDRLPDFTLPVSKLIKELKAQKKRSINPHALTAIIAFLNNYLAYAPIYSRRIVNRSGGTSSPRSTPDYKSLPLSFVADEDEPKMISHESFETANQERVTEPTENLADERTSKRHFEVKLIAPDDVQKSLSLKNQLAKSALHHILKREKQLTTDFHHLTAHEVNILVEFCFHRLPTNMECGCLLVSLFLGRTIDEIINHNGALKIGKVEPFIDTPVWGFKPNLPIHEVKQKLETLLVRPDGEVVLSLPKKLELAARSLASFKGDINNLRDTIKAVLREINTEKNTRITLPRIVNYMSIYLANLGQDASEIALLTGRNISQEPGCSYYQVQVQSLFSLHQNYINTLLEDSFEKEKLVVNKKSHLTVGSYLQVKLDKLYSLFDQMHTTLESIRKNGWVEIENFHNNYTIFTLFILNLSTGHRPVRHPYHSIECFDLLAKTVHISDKEIRTGLSARVLPLPEVACEQVNNYLSHLSSIASYYQNIEPVTGNKIQQSLNGKGPLFFFLKENSFLPVTPKVLNEYVEFIFPIRLNWNRHLMRSWLRRQGIRGPIVDTWMGHVGTGGDGFARYSGISIADLRLLTEKIDMLITQKFNISAVQGWEA